MTASEAAALARRRPALHLHTQQGLARVVCPVSAQGVLDAYATAAAMGAWVEVRCKGANRQPLTEKQRAANERIFAKRESGEWRT